MTDAMMTEEEKQEREIGIQAIIFLQATVGKVEPREKAERAWDGFKKWEKDQTLAAYALLSKKDKYQTCHSQ